MLTAAGELTPAHGLRPASMHCLLGLMAATGLRVSEALHLQRVDVDLDQGLLCVRQTKFRKSRYVPWHPTARDALAEYAPCAISACRRPGIRPSSCSTTVEPSVTDKLCTPSSGSAPASVGTQCRADAPDSMTCATPSPATGSSGGTSRASMWTGPCRCWQRIWATPR